MIPCFFIIFYLKLAYNIVKKMLSIVKKGENSMSMFINFLKMPNEFALNFLFRKKSESPMIQRSLFHVFHFWIQ